MTTYPPLYPQLQEPQCIPCEDRGWLISTRSDARKAVERCDSCMCFETDMDAAREAAKAGVSCEQSYPCYLK